MWSLKIAQRLSYPLKSLPDIRHSWGSYRSSRRPSRPSPPAETSGWSFEPAHPCVVRAFHYISGSKYLQKQPLYTAIKCQDTFYFIHTHFFRCNESNDRASRIFVQNPLWVSRCNLRNVYRVAWLAASSSFRCVGVISLPFAPCHVISSEALNEGALRCVTLRPVITLHVFLSCCLHGFYFQK